MGVSGCGKSTVGRALAERLGAAFIDADDFHPTSNLVKMRTGTPLQDEDRWSWLNAINERLRKGQANESIQVLACSALKEVYRTRLKAGLPQVWKICFICGEKDKLLKRINQRPDHFMPASLLDSQLADLEEPSNALRLDLSLSVNAQVEKILENSTA